MPRLRYTGGGTYRVGGYGFEPGDVKDVGDDLGEYLADHDDFEVVDGAAESDQADDSEATTEDADEAPADEFDAGAFVDRTPMDDVVEDIRAGEADDHLDAVAEVAERVGVQDAIGKRRAELED